ncbi:hypothetical protein Pan44_35900 [Caulifigura coniformis]|uniref:Uncharacterized protein n=1 Tax=Caulifigura coniformis TaxID=2527983 RepID=A0A517SHE3_9PLAN|nr:hypothetical protein [Caulifigura coniformis]QDT55546.1 hypothetical protein Pan44_35900 [Caulifigura coniformis]
MPSGRNALACVGVVALCLVESAPAADPPSQPPNPPRPERVFPAPKPEPSPESRLGERSAVKAEPTSTTLHIDLLMNDATEALQSQTWGRVFDALGHRVRVRTAGVDDEAAIEESRRGPLRTVQLTGRLDRRGTLTFPGRTFKTGDERALKEWLEELEAYGAQGSPAGQPRWGLNTEQFQGLFRSLAEDVSTDLQGQPLIDAARSLGFGIDIPLRVHDSVAGKWNSTESPLVVAQDVRALSRGSAFAVLLNDAGLCFRPLRTPSGSIDLVVLNRAETPDPWPIGWAPRPDVQRSDYAPSLFAFGPIGFLDRPVTEMLQDARDQTGCAIVIDHPGIAKKEVDLVKKTFGLPQKKTAWVLVLQSALAGTGLVPHIRVDEAGRGFIFIAPFESRAISNQ